MEATMPLPRTTWMNRRRDFARDSSATGWDGMVMHALRRGRPAFPQASRRLRKPFLDPPGAHADCGLPVANGQSAAGPDWIGAGHEFDRARYPSESGFGYFASALQPSSEWLCLA